jgi:hypothetical protein
MIIFEGPSILDPSQNIVAIASDNTSNKKTGAMVQVWILHQDIAPHHATKSGDDYAICGNCPHRHHTGGACYVLPFQAPLAVWTAYKNQTTPTVDLTGRQVRFGAYGDPAAVPFEAWRPFLEICDLDGSTGYTHQIAHPKFDSRTAMFCQISADTPNQALYAQQLGFHTFRVAGDASKRMPGEIECLADAKGLTCHECKLCDGNSKNIVITAHGQRKAKTHDVIAIG